MAEIDQSWLYTDEELLLKKSIREFCEAELAPTWWDSYQRDKHHEWYHTMIKKLGEQDYFRASVPEALGGAGMGNMAMFIITEEVARINGGMSIQAGGQSTFAMMMAGLCPSAYEQYGEAILDGDLVIAVAANSPEGQCNFKEQAPLASFDEEAQEWVLNGEKAFSSGGTIADILLVQCLYGDDAYMFIMNPETPGLTITANPEMGCGADYATLSMNNIRLPKDMGFKTYDVVDRTLNVAKPSAKAGSLRVAFMSLGAASAALEMTTDYLKHRTFEGKPIAALGSVQHQITELKAQLEAARAMCISAARGIDKGDPDSIGLASMAKAYTCDICAKVCYEAIQLYGCTGYNPLTGLERYLRDCVGFSIGRAGHQQHLQTAATCMGLPGATFMCA